jgi:short-subunit dehydrogenase
MMQYGTIHQTYDDRSVEDMINVNCLHPVYLNKALLPRLSVRKGRKAIINVSSIASVGPIPGLAIYNSTKTFLSYFTTAL